MPNEGIQRTEAQTRCWLNYLSSLSYELALSAAESWDYGKASSKLNKDLSQLSSELHRIDYTLKHDGRTLEEQYPLRGAQTKDKSLYAHTYREHIESLEHMAKVYAWQAAVLKGKVETAANTRSTQVSRLLAHWDQLKADFDALKISDKQAADLYREASDMDQKLRRFQKEISKTPSAREEYEPVRKQISQTMLGEMLDVLLKTMIKGLEDELKQTRDQGARKESHEERPQEPGQRDDEGQQTTNETSRTQQEGNSAQPLSDVVAELLRKWDLLKSEFDALKESGRQSPLYIHQIQAMYERLKQLYAEFDCTAPSLAKDDQYRCQMAEAVDEARDMVKQATKARVHARTREEPAQQPRRRNDGEQRYTTSASTNQQREYPQNHRRQTPQPPQQDRYGSSSRSRRATPPYGNEHDRDYRFRGFRDDRQQYWSEHSDSHHRPWARSRHRSRTSSRGWLRRMEDFFDVRF